jgi:hypothetical protein
MVRPLIFNDTLHTAAGSKPAVLLISTDALQLLTLLPATLVAAIA